MVNYGRVNNTVVSSYTALKMFEDLSHFESRKGIKVLNYLTDNKLFWLIINTRKTGKSAYLHIINGDESNVSLTLMYFYIFL